MDVAVRRAVSAALMMTAVVSVQLVNTATCADRGAAVVDSARLKRDVVHGLRLERMPDASKVDISNDEFHRKYLEYFRRLYAADESERLAGDDATGYDNDVVSATQVRGRVKRRVDNSADDESRPSTDDEARVTIAFPMDRRTAGRGAVIRCVARIYGRRVGGADARVRVHGRLVAGGPRERWRPVADVTWPADGGRWRDVDVTRLLRRRWPGGRAAALELSLDGAAAGRLATTDDDDDDDDARLPVLHVFRDRNGREKRDGGEQRRLRRRRRRRRLRRPAAAGLVRRTDCKADDAGNGTANKCCREPMRVVFADVPGFDFIVEPKWFDAGLCRGRCPVKYNPATRHAFIQSLLWKQHNDDNDDNDNDDNDNDDNDNDDKRNRRKVRHGGGAAAHRPPKPCCAPSKLDRLQIIHVDEMNPTALKVTTWQEMSVLECACS